MRNILIITLLALSATANAQFTVEMLDGNSVNIDGDVKFSQSADMESWSVGETYDPALELSLIKNIRTNSDMFANKTFWVYGVDAPDFPGIEKATTCPIWTSTFPEGEWIRYDYASIGIDSEVQKLTWKEGCGWYDCNKTYEYDNAEDKNMCWAASASNLLHWWLTNNKKYIDMYDEVYGQKYSFARPSEAFAPPVVPNYASNKSEIFKFFISTFKNAAGWSGSGVNWFVNGNSTNISAAFKDSEFGKTFTGFFPDVFSEDDDISEESRDMTKENFNEMMKRAFTENKAIGVAVYDIVGKNTGIHALNIWGAEFDEEGYVSHVYYSENNSPDQDPNGASLTRFCITYQKNPNGYSDDEVTYFTQLPKPLGGTQNKYSVSALFLIDLRQDIWEEWAQNLE